MRRIDDGSASLDSQRLARVSAQFEAHRSGTPLPTQPYSHESPRGVERPCELAPSVLRRSAARVPAWNPASGTKTDQPD
jgi:hypothetical protein